MLFNPLRCLCTHRYIYNFSWLGFELLNPVILSNLSYHIPCYVCYCFAIINELFCLNSKYAFSLNFIQRLFIDLRITVGLIEKVFVWSWQESPGMCNCLFLGFSALSHECFWMNNELFSRLIRRKPISHKYEVPYFVDVHIWIWSREIAKYFTMCWTDEFFSHETER